MTRALSKVRSIRVRLGDVACMHGPVSSQAKTYAVEDVSLIAGEGKRLLAGELERRIGIL